MSVPQPIEEILQHSDQDRDIHNPDKHPCQGSKFHSPRPLYVHRLVMADGKVIYLCGTCRDNLNTYLYLHQNTGKMDWVVLRGFGNQLRMVGDAVLLAQRKSHAE